MMRLILALVMLAGCLEEIEYVPSARHHEEQLGYDAFSDFYGERVDVRIVWTRDLEVGDRELFGHSASESYFFLWPRSDCDTVYIKNTHVQVEYTSLAHELTHCLLWLRNHDMDPDHGDDEWSNIPHIHEIIKERRDNGAVGWSRS